MSDKKLKVVWICHFTNAEIQSLLPLRKKKNEFAPWIPSILKGFEYRDDIEIHVISPHEYLKRTTKISIRNINYYFIPYGIPVWHRHWFRFIRLDLLSNFYSFRKKVKRVVDNIKPDIINLMGAENAYYSSSILDFEKKYPTLVLIQGFISSLIDELKQSNKYSFDAKKRIYFEEKIIKTFTNFCGEKDSSTYISAYNPGHKFFKLFFPVNEELVGALPDTEKKYDCIYFGRLEKYKGVEDFIKVISEIKKNKADVKACIIGSGNKEPLYSLAKDLDCFDNIEFVGFVESQKELFEYVKSSRVFLAPPFKERLSSTIRESMLLKVPIVAYATGGIPYINEYDENIYLVDTGDYKEMARKTMLLLEDDERRCRLIEKAYQYCIDEYSLKVNTERLISYYRTILKH